MDTHAEMRRLADDALNVQMACNLSGIVHSFSKAMTTLREIAREEGWESTDKLNTHPVAILYSSKIASLTGSETSLNFSNAYKWAEDFGVYDNHCHE